MLKLGRLSEGEVKGKWGGSAGWWWWWSWAEGGGGVHVVRSPESLDAPMAFSDPCNCSGVAQMERMEKDGVPSSPDSYCNQNSKKQKNKNVPLL